MTITIAPLLVAVDQDVSVPHDTSALFKLTAQGGRPPYTFGNLSTLSNGTLSGTPPNLTYTPNGGFDGTDTVSFEVTDANGSVATGTVTFNIVGPLQAVDQTLDTVINTAIPVTFGAEAGRSPYHFILNTRPANGAVLGDEPAVTYIPYQGFLGSDSFTFIATDANGAADEGTITVVVSEAMTPIPPSDVGSLAAAIQAANSTGTPVSLSLMAGSTYMLTGPLPEITGHLTLVGNGATLNGSGSSAAVLTVAAGGALTVNDLMITAGTNGGLSNNGGVLLIINSTIYDNSTLGDGGGVQTNGGHTQVVNSTITGNQAARGGGVYNAADGVTTLISATVSSNDASQGDGLSNISGQIVLENSLIADNNGVNCAGVIQSNGHNIEYGNTCSLNAVGDQTDTDPLLQPLQSYGGPTLTQAIPANSPAIDSGDSTACYWADQRGADRPQDGNGDGRAGCDVGPFEVQDVNNPPLNTVPGPHDMIEDDNLVFSTSAQNALSISDPDAGSNPVQVTLSVMPGGVTLTRRTGLTFSVGDGINDPTMTFTGTISAINAALRYQLSYKPPALYVGTATLTITTNDQGHQGAGGPQSDIDQVLITIQPYNTAPDITIPPAQTILVDTSLVFSSAEGNPISIQDSDAGEGMLKVMLSVEHGNLTLSSTTGLAFNGGDGLNDLAMTFQGSLTAINAALDGLIYMPAVSYLGEDTLYVFVDDQGHTGYGGVRTKGKSVSIGIRLLGTPALLTPSDGALTADNTPMFAWEPVPGAAQYRLQVDKVINFSSPAALVIVTGTTYTLDTPLNNNTIYFWRVQALSGGGAGGDWSAAWSFTIDTARLRAPTLALPKDRTNTAGSDADAQLECGERREGLSGAVVRPIPPGRCASKGRSPR